jgi:alkanesulfonate monooxygenase SsuD/methylene tetrahydromethanopterin reductase-like flavin-dependent oxidoreductase (luciferase family)
MKVGVSINTLNTVDWERVNAGDWSRPPVRPDWEAFRGTLALGELVEPLGFDSLWVSEHFGSPYGMVPNTLQMLAYWAGRTERVDLGSIVVVLPWWNPVRLAHEVAMLDLLLAGRRFRFGVGRGVSREEYDSLGIPQGESRERFKETLDILELALSRERFSYEGAIFTIPPTSIRPQWRSPDLMQGALCASTSPESMQIAAARGLGQLFVTGAPLPELRRQVTEFNTIRAERGLEAQQPTVYMWAHCVETEAEAEDAMRYFRRYQLEAADHYGFTRPGNFDGLKGYERYAVRQASGAGGPTGGDSPAFGEVQFIGTPDQIIANAEYLQEMTSTAEIVVLFQYGGIEDTAAQRSMHMFAREVLPVLHAMPAPLRDEHRPQPAVVA